MRRTTSLLLAVGRALLLLRIQHRYCPWGQLLASTTHWRSCPCQRHGSLRSVDRLYPRRKNVERGKVITSLLRMQFPESSWDGTFSKGTCGVANTSLQIFETSLSWTYDSTRWPRTHVLMYCEFVKYLSQCHASFLQRVVTTRSTDPLRNYLCDGKMSSHQRWPTFPCRRNWMRQVCRRIKSRSSMMTPPFEDMSLPIPMPSTGTLVSSWSRTLGMHRPPGLAILPPDRLQADPT